MNRRRLNQRGRGINLREAQRIQDQLRREQQARKAEYFRRQDAGQDTSDLNIDNDFDMSDTVSDNEAEGEWMDIEGGQD